MTRTRTAPATGIVTALLYSRVSTEEQGDTGVSLAAQVSECQRYVQAKGWVIGSEFQDVMSGKRNDRPGYVALIEEMHRLRRERRAVAVVTADIDRLGRDLLESLRFRKLELRPQGVPLHVVREGGEVDDLKADLMAVIAENESARTSRRVKATRADLIDKGWAPPGREAWGLRWRDSTPEEKQQGAPRRVLDRHPDEAPFVEELFVRAEGGEPTRGLLKWVRALPDAARGGRRMNHSGIRNALNAPVYVGRSGSRRMYPDAEAILAEPVGHWPSLVTDEAWRAVHRRLAQNERMPSQASGEYLLTGLLRCWNCGNRMGGVSRTDRGGRHHKKSYRCHNWVEGCLTSVGQKTMNGLVEQRVGALLRPMTLDKKRRAEMDAAWRAQHAPVKPSKSQKQREQQEAISTRARQRIDVATDRFLDGGLTKDEYDRAVARYTREIEQVETALAAMTTSARPAQDGIASNLPELLRMLDDLAKGFASDDVAERRDALRALVVQIRPERRAYGDYRLDIAWTPLGDALEWLTGRAAEIVNDGLAGAGEADDPQEVAA